MFDIPRTITETAWLKEITILRRTGESKDVMVQGYPLSHFLKLRNPTEKGSSSRGTAIYETTALITNVQDADDPDNLLTIIFDELQKMAFSSKSGAPDLMNVQIFGEGMGTPFYIPMRSPAQNNTQAIKAQFLQLSTSETLTSIFNNELSVKICGYWAPGGSECVHDVYAKQLLKVIGSNFRLVVYNDIKQVIMNTNHAKHVIFLQLKYNHFDVILKPHLFLNVRKICNQCLKSMQPNYHPRGCMPKFIRYIYFDIESQIIHGAHKPILLSCYTYCTSCADNNVDIDDQTRSKECRCGPSLRYKSFNGFDGISPVDKFVDYIIRFNSKKPAKTIILAHNFSRYDGHLLLEVLYQRNYDVDIVAQGFKMYSMKIKLPGQTIEFKDSLNFIPSPLKDLPNMFGFKSDSTKGYFPHGANTPENLHKTFNCLPAPEDYWCDMMKPEDRKNFMEWYAKNKHPLLILQRKWSHTVKWIV
uniref:DNA-directed DNA polymerase n=1 Tax=Panagrolaimus superbus TaxID=310955 RepID=A0A914YWF2_9BILA